MTAHLDRALLLVDQSRYELAEQELRQELAANPEHPVAHGLLSLCLAERKAFPEATAEAQAAIHQAPDHPYGHYALSKVMLARRQPEAAAAAILEAIALDPDHPDFFAQLAFIRLDQRRWQDALTAADEGLAVNAEHTGCANLRAMALVQLGRRQEAGQSLASTLAKDPNNALSHANQGWALLDAGKHQPAMEHFREALRLDPQLDWARMGIVEALKARHFIYGVLLRYFLWMGKLSAQTRWGIIIGGVIGYNLLDRVSQSSPVLAPWLFPLIVAYWLFLYLTWTADPLFNLLLRLNRFGRHALSRPEIVASNWVAAFFFPALLCLVLWMVIGGDVSRGGLLIFGLLVIPLSATFHCEWGWPRAAMAALSGGLALLGGASLAFTLLSTGPGSAYAELGKVLLSLFVVGVGISTWVANGLMGVRLRR